MFDLIPPLQNIQEYESWERLLLNSCRYKCINKKDGIAKKVDSNGTMEGSDDRDRAYKCDAEGVYTLPKGIGNSYKFPKCIPRRK